jgi:phosphate transport system substrate-binding protein
MMQLAATEYQQAHKDVQISVTAGGSGAGRAQVCKGQVNIGNSDVPLSDKEKTDLNCGDAVQTPVAIQAFGPVANKQGPGSVSSLTKDQLVAIFSGQTKNWKDLGGDDQQIVIVNRAKGSGTRSNMAHYLFGGDDTKFVAGASEEDNNETVLQTVSQTPGAISYLGFAYLNNPEIVAFGIDNIKPTREDIQNGKWPIAAQGFSITKGQPTGATKAFLDFVTSAQFQNSPEFARLGFVPVAK